MKKYLSIFMVMAMFAFAFSSCSSGDEETSVSQSVKTSLIGAWRTSMESYNWRKVCLMSNGELIHGYLTKKDLEEYTYDGSVIEYAQAPNARWAYDEATQTLSMYTDDGYYAYSFKVNMADDRKSFAGIDTKNGKTYTFVKIEE